MWDLFKKLFIKLGNNCKSNQSEEKYKWETEIKIRYL